MSILPGTKAPWFSSVGFQEGAFYDISLNDFNSDGKWLVLFFYPLDFGYISPSELVALEGRRGELEGLGCRLVAVSQDSAVSHHRFGDIHCGFGGDFGLGFPLVEDPAGAISRLYGVDRAGAGHSHRAYFIIDPEQTVRARVVGDLPVALGVGEMVRQVRALQLALSGAFVDGAGGRIGDTPAALAGEAETPSPGLFETHSGFYNRAILGTAEHPVAASGRLQSPVDLTSPEEDPALGPLSFHYTPVWAADPEPWSPGSLAATTVSPQPTIVANSGRGWEVRTPHHYQLTITHGPLHDRDYRLDHYHCHWGSSEHAVEGETFAGELHLVHHGLQYKDLQEAAGHAGGVAVVAVLLTEDDENPNPELEKIGEVLPQITLAGEQAQTAEVVEVEGLLPGDRDYLTYRGSLTSPGFQEGAVWAVLVHPVGVSRACLARMQQLRFGGRGSARVRSNCRERVGLGDRQVYRPAREDADSQNELGLTKF